MSTYSYLEAQKKVKQLVNDGLIEEMRVTGPGVTKAYLNQRLHEYSQMNVKWVVEITNKIHTRNDNKNNKWTLQSVGMTLHFDTKPTQQTMINEINKILDNTARKLHYAHYMLGNDGVYYYKIIRGDPETGTLKLKNFSAITYATSKLLSRAKGYFQTISRRDTTHVPIDLSIGANVQLDIPDMCIVETLYKYLKTTKFHDKTTRYTIPQLVKQFCDIKKYDGPSDDQMAYIQKEGISADELIEWRVKYIPHVGMYLLDVNNQAFHEVKSEANKGSKHSIFIKMKNEHAYWITDDSCKAQIAEHGKIVKQPLKSIAGTVLISEMTVLENDSNLIENIQQSQSEYVVIKDHWNNIFKKYVLNVDREITKWNCTGYNVTMFECPVSNKLCLIIPDYDNMVKMYDTLSHYKEKTTKHLLPDNIISYHGGNVSSLYKDLEKHIIGVLPTSSYNVKDLEYMDSFKRPALLENYVDEKDFDYKRGVGIDSSKNDSYSLYDLLGDVPVFSDNDKIEPYDGKDIRCGLYKVTEFYMYNGFAIYCPTCFYTYGFVKKCLEYKIITKDMIKEQYLSRGCIKQTTFKSLVKFIYDVFPPSQAKQITNIGVGMYGTKYRKTMESFMTSSWKECESMYEDGYRPVSFSNKFSKDEISKRTMHMCRKQTKVRLTEDNRPIYLSVIDRSIWQLYKIMVNKIGCGKLHGIRRDCIYGIGFDKVKGKDECDVEYGEHKRFGELGTYRKEHYNPAVLNTSNNQTGLKNDVGCYIRENHSSKYTQLHMDNNKVSNEINKGAKNYICEQKQRDLLVKYLIQEGSGLITGGGGYGKSTLMKKLYDELELVDKKCLVMAPTNKAVDNLKKLEMPATTVHAGLTKRSEDGDIRPRYEAGDTLEFDAVLVDEAYNMSAYLSSLVYGLWCDFNVNVYFVGDKQQCLPVECKDDVTSYGITYDYDDSSAWSDMLKCRFELSYFEGSRYDKKLKTQLDKVLKCKAPNIRICNGTAKRFLAKTNKKVDELNTMAMKGNPDKFDIPAKKYGSQSLITEVRLIKGSPVTPHTKGDGFYNNQDFTYIRTDNVHVYLKNAEGETVEIGYNVFCNSFIPSYAMTTNRSQGSTFRFKYTVHETHLMNRNELYVALSRATSYNNVFVYKKIKEVIPYVYSTKCVYINPRKISSEGCIYKITNDLNNNIYIGSTTQQPDERFIQHMKCNKTKFHKEVQKLGADHFKIEVVEKVAFSNKNELIQKEKVYIQKYDPSIMYNTLLLDKQTQKSKQTTVIKDVRPTGVRHEKSKCRYYFIENKSKTCFSYKESTVKGKQAKYTEQEAYKACCEYAMKI